MSDIFHKLYAQAPLGFLMTDMFHKNSHSVDGRRHRLSYGLYTENR